jgi:type IV pilus assembly protein PilA
LIELLIVIAIIGILAAVLIPNLLSARGNAVKRAAEAYAQNVYKAAFAFIAESPDNTLADDDCKDGYSAGSFSVPDPGVGTVAACDITFGGGTTPTVEVTVSDAGGGSTITVPKP